LAESIMRKPGVRTAYMSLRRMVPASVRRILRRPREGVSAQDLARLLDEAHEIAHLTPGDGDLRGRRLVLFGYLPWWIDFMVAVGAALIARGADVTFAWLSYGAFDRETPDLDRDMIARYGDLLARRWPHFRAVNLVGIDAPPAATFDELRRTAVLD